MAALLVRPLAHRISGGTQLAIGLFGVAAGQALMIPAHSFETIAPGLLLLLHGTAPGEPGSANLPAGWSAAALVTTTLTVLGGLVLLILNRRVILNRRARGGPAVG